MGESFADLFEESLQQVEMNKGALITGEVIAIDMYYLLLIPLK